MTAQSIYDGRSERIEEEAQDWVLRLAEDPSPANTEACRAWRGEAPPNEEAFRLASKAWEIAGHTRSAMRQDWRAEAMALPRSRWLSISMGSAPRRAGVGLAIAASIIAAIGLPATPDVQMDTKTAEIRAVRLADGSKVTIGARSAMAVDFDADARRVALNEGQAFFEVAHDRGRPFTVVAGDVEIEVTGTKFDVRWIGKDVQVSVLEGRVELRRRPLIGLLRAKSPERVLTAGQQSELQPDGFAPSKQTAVPAGDWRTGRFYYLDAPLGEVVADAARYSATPIRIADPAVASMRVTISFEASGIANLLGNLEEILPVETRRTADGSVIVASR